MEEVSRASSPQKPTPGAGAASRPVGVERIFRVPVERVWRAFSDPDLMQHWWGPEGFTCPEAKVDFREGGRYLLAMKEEKSGKIYWSGGTYKSIEPNKRIEYTDQFTDSNGKPVSPKEYGVPGEWPEFQSVTLSFEAEDDDDTKLILRHEGIPEEMHDECVLGWNSCFDKLQRLVETS